MLGICIVFGAALFVAVLLPRNAGLAGLALTSALNLTGLDFSSFDALLPIYLHVHTMPRLIANCMAAVQVFACCPGSLHIAPIHFLHICSTRHVFSWQDWLFAHGKPAFIMYLR